MHQTTYRSSLGGHVSRPPGTGVRGTRGINSRVQDTAWLLSHVAQPAPVDATPSRRTRERRQYGHPGAFSGINSRVQDTAWLLSHVGQPARATARRPGMGILDPITQGIIIGMGTEWALKAMQADPQLEELERQARIEKAARELSYPMADRGVVGRDRFIYIDPRPFSHGLGPRSGLGHLASIPNGLGYVQGLGWVQFAVMGAMYAANAFRGKKRGPQKEATTQIVNEAESILQQNLQAWESSPKNESTQRQALANFDQVWEGVEVQCGNPQYGPPGEWCIEDRARGGEWDWFARYRDPIANDPAVVADQPAPTTIRDQTTGQVIHVQAPPQQATDWTPLLIAGAVALVAMNM